MSDLDERLGFTWPRGDWVVDEFAPPLLILGVDVLYDDLRRTAAGEPSGPLAWTMAPGREWQRIAHQSAGVGCHHSFYLATVLTPHPAVAAALADLHGRWEGTDTGVWGVPLAEVVAYRDRLAALIPGATCERVYRDFEEALYPIDCAGAADVRRLALDDVPDDLNALVAWKSDMQCFLGSVGRWGLWALGVNSD